MTSSKVVTVGFQGESGAFSEEAALALLGNARAEGFLNFDALVEAVDSGHVSYGLLPVENSIYGQIARSYDLLWMHPALHVVDETVHHVVQALIGTPGATIDGIREVRSHPVALEQCRRLLDAHPSWHAVTVEDTAGAVREIMERGDPGVAAIGPASSAKRYGAIVLREGVQDDYDNFTRFFLISRDPTPRRELGRACIAIGLLRSEKPGTLRDALSAFADEAINLRSIVSRPSRSGPFTYRFYCEIEGVDRAKLDRALARIDGEAKILGIY
ncbi:MAG TPA: prephenate dehydratase domain-containing protein [Candidatus Binatia bacterium]|nr:prephenate dehydratase domain-containing protein [Candidatus Binatia bacterium]